PETHLTITPPERIADADGMVDPWTAELLNLKKTLAEVAEKPTENQVSAIAPALLDPGSYVTEDADAVAGNNFTRLIIQSANRGKYFKTVSVNSSVGTVNFELDIRTNLLGETLLIAKTNTFSFG